MFACFFVCWFNFDFKKFKISNINLGNLHFLYSVIVVLCLFVSLSLCLSLH